MKLKDFTAVPKHFITKMLPNIQTIKLFSIDIIDNNAKLLNFLVPSSSSNNKYISSILIDTENQITGNTECKFNCTCDSFKYQYSAILQKNKALINNITTLKLPKNAKLFICKHLYSSIRILFKYNNIENLKIIYKIKEEKKDD